MLKIFGTIRSRTARTIWMAEELGIAYELIEVDYRTRATRTPAFLAINPSGHVPAIDDDGLILTESIAINLYLVRRHPDSPLAPRDRVEDGRTLSWSLFAVNELESTALTLMMHGAVMPPERRLEDKLGRARGAIRPPLAVIEQTLNRPQPYLLGDRFTVADLNVAAILDWARALPEVLEEFPAVQAWLERCFSRPAYGRIRDLRRAAA